MKKIAIVGAGISGLFIANLLEQDKSFSYKVFDKKKDFVLKAKNKFNKTKYFETNIYKHKNKYLLIKNKKFNFLKNLIIFPMREINKDQFKISLNKKINVKMSNMNMKIIINKNNRKKIIKGSLMLDKSNINKYVLPSFTKKIFNSISNFS